MFEEIVKCAQCGEDQFSKKQKLTIGLLGLIASGIASGLVTDGFKVFVKRHNTKNLNTIVTS